MVNGLHPPDGLLQYQSFGNREILRQVLRLEQDILFHFSSN
jgi:hypothetical protein